MNKEEFEKYFMKILKKEQKKGLKRIVLVGKMIDYIYINYHVEKKTIHEIELLVKPEIEYRLRAIEKICNAFDNEIKIKIRESEIKAACDFCLW